MRALQKRQSFDIASLAEGVEAILVGRRGAWECRGRWRWSGTRSGRAVKRFEEIHDDGTVSVIPRHDMPETWEPVAAIPAPGMRRERIEPAAFESPDDADAIERRLLRALATDRALPDRERSRLRVRSGWPETCPGPGDYPPEAVTRFRPTKADLDDYLVVMGWFVRLDALERRACWLRARGATWKTMGAELDCHERTARQRYRAAVTRLGRIASGIEQSRSVRRFRHGR